MDKYSDLSSKITRMQSYLAILISEINPTLVEKNKVKSSEFFGQLLEVSDDKTRTADAECVLNEHIINMLKFGEILGDLNKMLETKKEKAKVVVLKRRPLEID